MKRPQRTRANSTTVARESLRTIFFQGVIETTDEAKREFTFLSALQSQRNVGWIAFAWPDGDFFGAEKRGERGIAMVEVRPEGDDKIRQRRVDTYEAERHTALLSGNACVRRAVRVYLTSGSTPAKGTRCR